MKKIQIMILVILLLGLGATAAAGVLQVQKKMSADREITKLKEETKELKEVVESRKKENGKLEAEIRELEAQTEELKKAEVLQDKKADEKEAEEAKDLKNGKKVAIDPGHQGSHLDMSAQEPLGPGSSQMKAKATSGTTGRFTGVPEFELNMNISRQLKEELVKRGYEILLTREDNDTKISNKERALMAADFGADIYVRIHANGSDNSGVSGAMTMAPSAQNPFVPQLHEKSYALGEYIINAYCESCGIKNNGVQLFDNMTGINWSQVPVVILEMGFMTNESDDRNMQDPDVQALMVQGIANGIDAYFAAGN